MSPGIGMSFIDATFSRWRWSDGMNERAQVGVYFTNGRQYLTDFSCA